MNQLSTIAALIGLCRKSGKLVVGHAAVAGAIKKKRARLVLVAQDAAGNTRSRFEFLAQSRQIPIRNIGSKAQWGKTLGRGDTAVVAIVDPSFANGIRAKLQPGDKSPQS